AQSARAETAQSRCGGRHRGRGGVHRAQAVGPRILNPVKRRSTAQEAEAPWPGGSPPSQKSPRFGRNQTGRRGFWGKRSRTAKPPKKRRRIMRFKSLASPLALIIGLGLAGAASAQDAGADAGAEWAIENGSMTINGAELSAEQA